MKVISISEKQGLCLDGLLLWTPIAIGGDEAASAVLGSLPPPGATNPPNGGEGWEQSSGRGPSLPIVRNNYPIHVSFQNVFLSMHLSIGEHCC